MALISRSDFGDIWDQMFSDMLWPRLEKRNFAVDILEHNDHFSISADLPGFTKDDIAIEHQNGMLAITAQASSNTNLSNGKYYRQERSAAKMYRSFTLPENVDADKMTASLLNGVLTLKMPKIKTNSKLEKPKRVLVQ